MKFSRRGFTLVEMVIVLTLASLVMTLATVTLVALLRVGKQASDDTAQDVALSRLASRWRADVHAATGSVVSGDCVLTMPGERKIRYAFAVPAVTREVVRGEAIEHRDAFVLPKRARATFTLVTGHEGRIHRLEIRDAELPDQAFAVPVRPMALEAAIGLHGPPLAKGGSP